MDDIALAAYVINGIVNKTSPEVVARHWAGDGDVLELVAKASVQAAISPQSYHAHPREAEWAFVITPHYRNTSVGPHGCVLRTG